MSITGRDSGTATWTRTMTVTSPMIVHSEAPRARRRVTAISSTIEYGAATNAASATNQRNDVVPGRNIAAGAAAAVMAIRAHNEARIACPSGPDN